MNMDRQNESDVTNVYFLLQVIYLFKGKDQPMDALVIETVRSLARLYPGYDEAVAQIIEHLEAKESFKALKVAHAMLAEYEKNMKGQAPANSSVAEPVPALP